MICEKCGRNSRLNISGLCDSCNFIVALRIDKISEKEAIECIKEIITKFPKLKNILDK